MGGQEVGYGHHHRGCGARMTFLIQFVTIIPWANASVQLHGNRLLMSLPIDKIQFRMLKKTRKLVLLILGSTQNIPNKVLVSF